MLQAMIIGAAISLDVTSFQQYDLHAEMRIHIDYVLTDIISG